MITSPETRPADRDAPSASDAWSPVSAQLLAAVEHLPDAFVALDREWRVVAVNAAAERARGLTRAEMLGRTHWEVWPESVGGEVERGYRRAVAEGAPVRFAYQPGGPRTEIWIEISAYPSAAGLAIFARDVSAGKRAEAALRASEARFRGLFEGIADGVVVTGEDGAYVEVNAAFAALTGYARDELIGRRVPTLATDAEFSRREYERLQREGRWQGEAAIRHKDGRVIPVESRARRVDLPSGPVFIGTMRDVSERRELERLREDGLGVLAHDLRNPLAAAKGQTQLLRRRLRRSTAPDPAAIAAGLEAVETAIERAVALIEELLDAARLRAGRSLALRATPTDLTELVGAVVDEYARTTDRHRLTIEPAAARLVAAVDRARLERVIGNLLANAIKYSPDGGEIAVHLDRAEDETGTWAMIAVADEGIGIPAADLPHVFERYRRGGNVAATIDGTGIGLAGARRIVEQHGGTISAESREGRGSTFTVRLRLN